MYDAETIQPVHLRCPEIYLDNKALNRKYILSEQAISLEHARNTYALSPFQGSLQISPVSRSGTRATFPRRKMASWKVNCSV